MRLTVGARGQLWASKVAVGKGHNISVTSPYHLAAEHFAEQVAERTDNRLNVQIFPAVRVHLRIALAQPNP